MIKTRKDTCTECMKEGDHDEKVIAWIKGSAKPRHAQERLCLRHNWERKKITATGGELIGFPKIPKHTKKRAWYERMIKAAKMRYRQQTNKNRCESCGRLTPYTGASHIISVNDCLNDPQIREAIEAGALPGISSGVELACSPLNLTNECHDLGYLHNCHQTTEAARPSSWPRKLRQANLYKKLKIYKAVRPYLYDGLTDLMMHNIFKSILYTYEHRRKNAGRQ